MAERSSMVAAAAVADQRDPAVVAGVNGLESASTQREACDRAFARDFAAPFPADRVRLTSIYSKGDGVVRWQSALVGDGDCVEVTRSHTGLIFNRKTYRVTASTLAVPELSIAARIADGDEPSIPGVP